MSILDGKLGGVVDGESFVPVISHLLAGTSLDVAIQELGAAEAELERAKKAVSDAKKKVARAFHIPR
ncbi:hypothetical protein D7S86_01395 [Pararobbsia silviterrae]|uniref:Uncharacterized protein n=2 Tax=Pararobbsia silviterrae TaxID=1792498 RepID=A0A494Y8B4_9BURK|nr:hypothetical protein D7S86_01395 [Pararobbsia silviterrae]